MTLAITVSVPSGTMSVSGLMRMVAFAEPAAMVTTLLAEAV